MRVKRQQLPCLHARAHGLQHRHPRTADRALRIWHQPARCERLISAAGTQKGTGTTKRSRPVKYDRKAAKRRADAKRLKSEKMSRATLRMGAQRGKCTKKQQRQQQPRPPPWWRRVASRTDGALVLGDVWMVSSTELASTLMPATQLWMHSGIALGAWLAVSSIRGDFTCYERLSEEGSHIMGWKVYSGLLQACATWPLYALLHIAVLAVLVSAGILEPGPVLHPEWGAKVSPVLEADLAILAVMSTWRAFYYAMCEGLL